MLRLARTPNVAEEEREDLQKRAQEKKRQVADFNELVGMLPGTARRWSRSGGSTTCSTPFSTRRPASEVTKSLRRPPASTQEKRRGARRRGEEGADGESGRHLECDTRQIYGRRQHDSN